MPNIASLTISEGSQSLYRAPRKFGSAESRAAYTDLSMLSNGSEDSYLHNLAPRRQDVTSLDEDDWGHFVEVVW